MIAVIYPLHAGDRDAVAQLAEEFSPRIECGASGVALDASGLSRLFGSAEGPRTAMSGAEGLARELARQAEAKGIRASIGVAAARIAAALAARARLDGWTVGRLAEPNLPTLQPSNPTIVIPSGSEASALAPLPLEALAAIEDLIGPALAKTAASATKRRRKGQGRSYRLAPAPPITKSPDHGITKSIDRLRRWGLRTLGDLAALPASDLSARLGDAGLILQRAARGEDERPLVPVTPAPSFMQSMRLEWPIDDLQPLSFIVSRLCDALEQSLAAADRGAISLTTTLRLVMPGGQASGLRNRAAYARTLSLPAPMRDARVLRTLVMLDLETHPPGAAIDEILIDVDVAPGRILQTGLFEPALPAPEALSTLVARLGAVAGESRVGAPALVDTHRPGAFEVRSFAPHKATGDRLQTTSQDENNPRPVVCRLWPSVIRRFRPPRPARVRVGGRAPIRIDAEDLSGDVVMAAGPWRASGGWWASAWDRDEWDVALETGVTCRVAQDRATGKWVVDGVLD